MRPAELRRDEEAAAALMQACSLGRDQAADWKRLAVVKLCLRKFDQAADCWRRVTDLPSVPGITISPFRLRRLM